MMRPDPYADRKKSLLSRDYYGAYCRRAGRTAVIDCVHPTKELCEHEGNPQAREESCFPRPAELFCDFPPADDLNDTDSHCFVSEDGCEATERICVRVAMGPAPSSPMEAGSLTPESMHRVRQKYSGQWCVVGARDMIFTCVSTDKGACERSRRGGECVERPDPFVCSYSARGVREGGREVVCHYYGAYCRRAGRTTVIDCVHPTKELCEHEGNPQAREESCFPRPAELFCDFPPADDPNDTDSHCFVSEDGCKATERI